MYEALVASITAKLRGYQVESIRKDNVIQKQGEIIRQHVLVEEELLKRLKACQERERQAEMKCSKV